MTAKRVAIIDRMLKAAGLPARASTSGYPAYQGASLTRMNSDWIGSLLSSDQEIRTSLKRLRARCRQLHNNNDYAQRFVSLIKQNVVGPNGITLESQMEDESDELHEQVNSEIERAWEDYCRLGNVTADGRMGFRDFLDLSMETISVEGEVFIRLIRNFRGNKFGFSTQFIDNDQVDPIHNRPRRVGPDGVENEIRMGIEVDEYTRPVAYWITEGHPSEGKLRRVRVPAAEMIHAYIFRRPGQTRGVPWMASAMTRLSMLGGYEEAELVAARMGACKMGFIYTEHPDDYAGGSRNADTGAVEPVLEPGTLERLPDGARVESTKWDHPNSGFGEFVKVMLRGVAVGCNVSYTSLTGDLNGVNYSSIRQGVLDERDSYRVLQSFAVEHICRPLFEAFLPIAIMNRQAALDPAQLDEYFQSVRWQCRGWTWVDPLKDISASIAARGAGLDTLADICARQGKDWRDVIDQIAIENAYAKTKGVELNFSKPTLNSIGRDPEAEPSPNPPAVPVDGPDEQDDENEGVND